MYPLTLIDELYAAFVETLGLRLADQARGLAFTLRLAPSADIPWSNVFKNEVTLMAPALVAEATPNVPQPIVRDAVLAHMLAVIEAFSTDRIEDGQVKSTSDLTALLTHVRRARDQALARVHSGVEDPLLDFGFADQKTMYAIAAERKLLLGGSATDFRTYEAASLGKQSVGFPAAIALGYAAGWGRSQRRMLHTMFAAIWVGLQMSDDVIDWEDDMALGGAWAVSMMRWSHEQNGDVDAADATAKSAEPHSLRQRVHSSRVLERMLHRSKQYFHAAKRRAKALGALRLSSWAHERERHVAALLDGERKSPGYAVRARLLSSWAGEVLT